SELPAAKDAFRRLIEPQPRRSAFADGRALGKPMVLLWAPRMRSVPAGYPPSLHPLPAEIARACCLEHGTSVLHARRRGAIRFRFRSSPAVLNLLLFRTAYSYRALASTRGKGLIGCCLVTYLGKDLLLKSSVRRPSPVLHLAMGSLCRFRFGSC